MTPIKYLADRKGGVAATGGALLIVLLVAAFALTSGSSSWTIMLAGGLLLTAGFVVMTPCQMQMSAAMTVVVKNLAAKKAQDLDTGVVKRAAALFALGYLIFYLPVALTLGGVAWVLGSYAWVLAIAGGVLSIVLGLAALGVGRSWLSKCRGPLYLIRSGRASFQKPFRAGIAFGQYCASCCGPYLYAIVVLAGATGMFWLGSSLVMLYAMTMVVPFLLPALLSPKTYAAVVDRVQYISPQLERATGMTLVGLGVLLVPIAVLLAAI